MTAIANDSKVVLQMPRGNLEVIHPRALVLHAVKKMLDQREYGQTYEILRRHRINLNIIVDHDPELFLSSISTFIQQIDDPQRLCLFVADLQ